MNLTVTDLLLWPIHNTAPDQLLAVPPPALPGLLQRCLLFWRAPEYVFEQPEPAHLLHLPTCSPWGRRDAQPGAERSEDAPLEENSEQNEEEGEGEGKQEVVELGEVWPPLKVGPGDVWWQPYRGRPECGSKGRHHLSCSSYKHLAPPFLRDDWIFR